MRLDALFADDDPLGALADVEVTNVAIDSRECRPGTLFFALPGSVTTGARFVRDALSRGAAAIVTADEVNEAAPIWRVPPEELHRRLVQASAAVVGHPERRLTLVGVTGTNGKTSVTTMYAGLWRALGRASSVIGTLTHERTTPAPPELYRSLAEFADRVHRSDQPMVALEVSSHALTQGRVDGLHFDVAVFTNLSHDHLDYHDTMEQYFEAKASLFTPVACRRAVVWIDDDYGRRLASNTTVPVTTVSRNEASDAVFRVGTTTFQWRGRTVNTSFSGQFNLDNALLVLTTAVTSGVSEDDAVTALADVEPVPGRFDVVRASGPAIVVDYAHTPDGLRHLLRDVRRVHAGRLVLVMGCGGDRDRGKRPLMGEVATSLADVTIITSDNPRSEDPESIIDDVVAGCSDDADWRRETDRRRAIGLAISLANNDDVVVIAGKGAEKTQTVGADVLEFDDRRVASEFVK